MELKRIVGMGLVAGMCWLGTSVGACAQEVETDTNVVEEQIQVEAMADSTVSEALVRERLAKLENIIPLRYHKVTHQFVEYFIYRKPSFVKRMLEQMHLYFPLYEQMLEKHGMPRELKFLSLIESGLNPRIISYAGAGGLWQFMPATGREYGMKQNDYIDERFDPVKSTEAACVYLKRLHRAFGDWEMALAAYNVGPGNVKRMKFSFLFVVVLTTLFLQAQPISTGKLTMPWREAGLTDRQAAAHLLDRFTYGARPKDIDKVVAMGLENWFEEQLQANSNDAIVKSKIAGYKTLNMTTREIARLAQLPHHLNLLVRLGL